MEDQSETTIVDGAVQLAFEVVGILSRIASAHELSLTQLRLIAILRDREPTMGRLAAFLGLDRSSITGLVDRAVERGLLARVPDPHDRRVVRIALTPTGAALAAEGFAEVSTALAPITAGITGTDGAQFAEQLNRAVRLLHPASEPR